jgi:hypothetical protein
MTSRKISKHLKAKSVGMRNASKDASKSSEKKGVSRVKRPSPQLKRVIDAANTAPDDFDQTRFVMEDQEIRDIWQRMKHASPKEKTVLDLEYLYRSMQLREEALPILQNVRMRQSLLAIIELAKTGDINYLRQCENCRNIFFAGRKDQTGCSSDCLKKIRKARWNKNYAEAKAGQRRGYLKY